MTRLHRTQVPDFDPTAHAGTQAFMEEDATPAETLLKAVRQSPITVTAVTNASGRAAFWRFQKSFSRLASTTLGILVPAHGPFEWRVGTLAPWGPGRDMALLTLLRQLTEHTGAVTVLETENLGGAAGAPAEAERPTGVRALKNLWAFYQLRPSEAPSVVADHVARLSFDPAAGADSFQVDFAAHLLEASDLLGHVPGAAQLLLNAAFIEAPPVADVQAVVSAAQAALDTAIPPNLASLLGSMADRLKNMERRHDAYFPGVPVDRGPMGLGARRAAQIAPPPPPAPAAPPNVDVAALLAMLVKVLGPDSGSRSGGGRRGGGGGGATRDDRAPRRPIECFACGGHHPIAQCNGTPRANWQADVPARFHDRIPEWEAGLLDPK